MNKKEIIEACKARAAANYSKFDMFVECSGPEEWNEFVEDSDTDTVRVFALMDSISSIWADQRADAAHYLMI